MELEVEIDKWELELEKRLKEIKECQASKEIDSCFKCKEIIGCEVRKIYVKAVYESMNKGQGGGFEF